VKISAVPNPGQILMALVRYGSGREDDADWHIVPIRAQEYVFGCAVVLAMIL
jgi:hypothetical protein